MPGGDAFPVRTLAGLAARGDAAARVKLLLALVESDGGLGGTYAAEAGRALTAAPPGAALDALAALPPAQRIVATSAVDWCDDSPKRILAFVPTPVPTLSPMPAASGATPPPTAAPTAPPSGAMPAPSPSPPIVALVQRQIRQAVAACAAVRARALSRPPLRRRSRGKAAGLSGKRAVPSGRSAAPNRGA